jgi:AcrR family transcriptional regulator
VSVAVGDADSARRVPRALREAQMLEAARELFGRRGYDGAAMDDIAERCGISKRLLYAYFESKERLFVACMEQVNAEIVDRIASGVREAPRPQLGLLYAEREFFAWVEANRDEWRLLASETARGKGFADTAARLRAKGAHVFAELIAETAAALGLAPPDPLEAEQVVYVLLGAGESLANWWLEHPDVPRETVAWRVASLGGHAVSELLGMTR